MQKRAGIYGVYLSAGSQELSAFGLRGIRARREKNLNLSHEKHS